MMKNGYSPSSSANGGTEFWNNNYKKYIRTIKFANNLSNLPTSCIGDSDLCWDVSSSSSQNKKVYAYLIDSGLDYTDSENVSHDLYNLYIVSEAPIFAPSSCSDMFFYFTNLISIDFNDNFNTSNVTNMEGMFSHCSSLTSLDVSSFNTSNVTTMNWMFYNCSSLTSLDISSFNTSNVTDMSDMFYNCSSLTSLDLSSFNTSNVTDMSDMFYNCSSLTSLDISSFNTSKVTTMRNMFNYCKSFTSLDLSSFNTSSVTSMLQMFADCSSLTSLDVSSFNTSKVTDMLYMFGGCSSLASLDLSGFNTSKVTDMKYMFYNCYNLTTTINIMNAGVTSYLNMFSSAATSSGAKITVNYIADASALVDNMIATKSSTSNVVKGSQI